MRTRTARRLRLLDLDIETRRVGFHTGGKFAPDGCEPVAIACSWVGQRDVRVWLLGEYQLPEMLGWFARLYQEADVVTGHYLRKFDLPILNGAMLEHGLPPLGRKLVSDTKEDLVSFAGLSKSQENLSRMLSLAEQKFHMADADWRDVARLTPDGMAEAKKRVAGDVRQHKRLRRTLVEAGWLKAPRGWSP